MSSNYHGVMLDTREGGREEMVRKPRLLDLFCGAGGCTKGYQQAGFYVVGVDIAPQPRYCGDEFIQADALTFPLAGFDVYHASPLCQHYTQMLNWNEQEKDNYPDLIGRIRDRLLATKKPYVIENVEGARSYLIDPIMLCGNMFGLRIYRHRLFESNVFLFAHSHIKHKVKAARASRLALPDEFWCPVGNFGQKDQAQKAMGIDWMKITGSKDREIAQAIPPAYTAWIGSQLIEYIKVESEVVA